MNDRSRLWDASIVVGGMLLAGLTLRTLPRLSTPRSGTARTKSDHRPQEADSAIASAKAFLTSHPEDFNAWSQLAIAYYYKGPESYADGLNAIEKARALGATSESLFYYAGVMDEAVGLPDYAANELSKYLRHHPDDYETQIRLANLLSGTKEV